jgi:flagellar biosynthesis/type III secretory pathway protein FliH
LQEILHTNEPPMRSGTGAVVEIFEYPAGPEPLLPSWDGLGEGCAESAGGAIAVSAAAGRAAGEGRQGQLERNVDDELRRSFEAGRAQGLQEGRLAERAAQTAARAAGEEQRAGQLAELIGSFAQERDRYLRAVEHEVVELALAVAARILRREAQMDPLLLTGAVRVALGQLSNSTQVRLRVPAAELDLWAEAIAHVPNLALKPTVVPGENMRLGDCVIQTELGSVDLGIRAQLGEIERGFFDRVGRAGTKAAAPESGHTHAEHETGVRP